MCIMLVKYVIKHFISAAAFPTVRKTVDCLLSPTLSGRTRQFAVRLSDSACKNVMVIMGWQTVRGIAVDKPDVPGEKSCNACRRVDLHITIRNSLSGLVAGPQAADFQYS